MPSGRVWARPASPCVGAVLLGEGWDTLKGVALLLIIGGVLILNLHSPLTDERAFQMRVRHRLAAETRLTGAHDWP